MTEQERIVSLPPLPEPREGFEQEATDRLTAAIRRRNAASERCIKILNEVHGEDGANVIGAMSDADTHLCRFILVLMVNQTELAMEICFLKYATMSYEEAEAWVARTESSAEGIEVLAGHLEALRDTEHDNDVLTVPNWAMASGQILGAIGAGFVR